MPLAMTTNAKTDLPLSVETIGRKPLSIAVASIIAACCVATSGCVALSIPSKRFHDPQDRGGLLGDFRGGGSHSIPAHEVDGDHFMGDLEHQASCSETGCAGGCGNGMAYDDFDDEAEFESGGHHHKAPEVPWPRYHPVPTRPVFSGYPGF